MSMTTFFTDARDIAEKTNELYCIKAMDFFFLNTKTNELSSHGKTERKSKGTMEEADLRRPPAM